MNPMNVRALMATLVLGMAGCSSTPVVSPATPGTASTAAAPGRSTPSAAATTGSTPAPASRVATVTLPDDRDPRNDLAAKRSVYFDFDESALRGADTPLIERHGRYLSSHPAVRIRVEGNTDERGSVEYNLALGQKRAESVLRALRIYGVRDAQVEAVSWGETKPRAGGHDESAWVLNRRADLQYPAK